VQRIFRTFCFESVALDPVLRLLPRQSEAKRSVTREVKTYARALVEQKVEEAMTYYAYPSTPLATDPDQQSTGRIIREIRRRTRVVGAFPLTDTRH
jgi:hypothetical protein